MTSGLPSWIANVPLKTVGVLCATYIFGKNIESRQIVLAGKRYFHNAVENVVNYVLNPILPPMNKPFDQAGAQTGEAAVALQNIRDCFNYIFYIQIEYFKILARLWPRRFKSKAGGTEYNLNWFSAKSPTLINSEKRYLILSKIDGAQPYDLDLDWNAEFDWVEDAIRDAFQERLIQAQNAYADTVGLGEWYGQREKNLILPLKTIMDDLSEYFEHLGLAAYNMARNGRPGTGERTAQIVENLHETCRHLERFTMDMHRVNVFTIVKHDLERLDAETVRAVIRVRAGDDLQIAHHGAEDRRKAYAELLYTLYDAIGFKASMRAGSDPAPVSA